LTTHEAAPAILDFSKVAHPDFEFDITAVWSPNCTITPTFFTKSQCVKYFLGIPARGGGGLAGITGVRE